MQLVLRSRHSLNILFLAGVSYALGAAFAALAWASISRTGSDRYSSLFRAGEWLQVGALVGVSVSVALAGRNSDPESGSREGRAETVLAALLGLLAASGYGVLAATSPYDASGHLIVALGFGLWAPLALLHSTHHIAASRRDDTDSTHPGLLWGAAAVGLILFAIGLDLVPVGFNAQRNGVATGILGTVGAALVACALLSARSRGWLSPRPTGLVALGMMILAATSVAITVVSQLELGSSGTYTGIRVGYALINAGTALAVLVLAAGAALQAFQLRRSGHPPADLSATPGHPT